MKRLLFFLMLIGLSACEFYYLEPRYDARDQIKGWHDVEEYSETYNDFTNYSIYIGYSDSYSNDIYIDNFYGADIRVCAYLSNGKIDIHRQVVDGYEIEGIGTVYGNEIEFIYSVKDMYLGTRRDYCESTAWRN